MDEFREGFEEVFPIPAHWIEWSLSKNRYDCHIGLADSKCSEYNNMFKVWQHQQAKINEYYEIGVALNTETINQRRYMASQSKKNNELQNRVDGALFEMRQLSLMLSKDIDGYEDPAQICQSEGVDMGVNILEKALRGANA